MSLLAWLLLLAVLIGVTIVTWLILTNVQPDIRLFDEEKYFKDSAGIDKPFPPPFSENPQDPVRLTFVVPAYNEESRLDPMMAETMDYCNQREKADSSFTYEIIIVSDGSKDKTVQVAQRWVSKYPTTIRVMALVKNRGKGGAVKRGVLASRGKYILFVDADGATKFSELDKLEKSLEKITTSDGHGICVGSRAHLQGQAEAKRSFFRNLLTWGFHFVVSYIGGVKGIRDTQCGFKLFTRPTANLVFPGLHIQRWAFDVEVLWLAQQNKIPIQEIHVDWTEIAGSHLEEEDTRIVSVQMFLDLLRLRLSYMIGLWKQSKHRRV